MTSDRVKGKGKETVGAAKERVGAATGNRRLKEQGMNTKIDQEAAVTANPKRRVLAKSARRPSFRFQLIRSRGGNCGLGHQGRGRRRPKGYRTGCRPPA